MHERGRQQRQRQREVGRGWELYREASPSVGEGPTGKMGLPEGPGFIEHPIRHWGQQDVFADGPESQKTWWTLGLGW